MRFHGKISLYLITFKIDIMNGSPYEHHMASCPVNIVVHRNSLHGHCVLQKNCCYLSLLLLQQVLSLLVLIISEAYGEISWKGPNYENHMVSCPVDIVVHVHSLQGHCVLQENCCCLSLLLLQQVPVHSLLSYFFGSLKEDASNIVFILVYPSNL